MTEHTQELIRHELGSRTKYEPLPIENVRQANPQLIKKVGEAAFESLVSSSLEAKPALSPRGMSWLVRTFGGKWAEVLGLPEDSDSKDITAKVVALRDYDTEFSAQQASIRLTGLLDGLSNAEITELTHGSNVSTTRVHLSVLSKYLRARQTNSAISSVMTKIDSKSIATNLPAHDASELDLDWHVDALCAQTDPEVFFPEKGASSSIAKKICAMCDVSVQCRQSALENGERFGVWGGLSERQLRAHK